MKVKKAGTLAAAIAALAIIAVFAFNLFPGEQGRGVAPLVFSSGPVKSSPFITEYPTQSRLTEPSGIAVDQNGVVWFVLQNRSALAEFNPANGTNNEYQLPSSQFSEMVTWAVLVQGSKNLVWFDDELTNAIWSFNTANHRFTEYPLGAANSFPFGMSLDGQGNVWFAEIGVNKIGEVTSSGAVKEYPLPPVHGIANTGPAGVAVSSSGVVWFTEAYAASIGSYSGGTFHQYNLSGRILAPAGIALDPSGNIWITEHGPDLFAEFNPATGYFKSVSTSVPTGLFASYPYFIYYGPGGRVWINEHYGNAIAEYDPALGTLVEYRIPTRVATAQNISGATTMTLAGGAPWFTEAYSGNVGSVDAQAQVPVQLNVSGGTKAPGGTPIPSGGSVTLKLAVTAPAGEETQLEVAVGNLTGALDNFNFTFSSSAGSGSYTATLNIANLGTHPGDYFLTISAVGSDVIVSQVVEVDTQS